MQGKVAIAGEASTRGPGEIPNQQARREVGVHVLEARGKRISEVSARWMEADAETLWAEIRELARNHDYQFAARILEVGEHEHWTVMHVALALAHAHIVLSNNHGQDLQEMMAFMNRSS